MSSSALFYYRHPTVAGPVFLFPEHDGRYQIVFRHESFGSYHTAEAAADEASEGLSALEIPADIAQWERKLYAYVQKRQTG